MPKHRTGTVPTTSSLSADLRLFSQHHHIHFNITSSLTNPTFQNQTPPFVSLGPRFEGSQELRPNFNLPLPTNEND